MKGRATYPGDLEDNDYDDIFLCSLSRTVFNVDWKNSFQPSLCKEKN